MNEEFLAGLEAEIRGAYYNAPPAAPGLCQVCTAPTTSEQYLLCSPCESAQSSGHQLAHDVVPLSWAPMPEGLDYGTHSYSGQGYLDLRQYKTPEAVQTQWRRLRSLFILAFAKHSACIVPDSDSRAYAITHVPSTSGQRNGTHPIETLLYGNFRDDRPRVTPEYVGEVGAPRAHRRQLNPSNWRIDPTQMQGAERVLILDDTWVTGGHAQSLAAAFAAIGVSARVIVLGRALDPRRNDHGSYLAEHRPALFDSSICPVHRVQHGSEHGVTA
ncbi:MAG: hypothetical protein EPO52_15285 [Herbiconiux sp.]|uniref:hypothetical protein n=1 Tax=Microbacteriaceae TaxID=85023 RepID=UPI001226F8BE|nr:hypothetical protein [Herbiconiux sp.]TAJ46891.1 MAG: hypothetical protein EPO52_15285 [Herbiconiux sp.]